MGDAAADQMEKLREESLASGGAVEAAKLAAAELAEAQGAEQESASSWSSWGLDLVSSAAAAVTSTVSYATTYAVTDPNGGEGGATGEVEDRRNLSAEHKAVFDQLAKMVGSDVTSLLSVPVWIMEPTSVIQKMAEIMEYPELLDRAARADTEAERLAWMCAFCTSVYGQVERTWKPFNPILGETFQLNVGNGVRYLAEQCSHHPPIGVAHAENELWEYDITSTPKTKFLGNSLEVYPVGRTRIKLKTTGDTYVLKPPNSKAYNLVVGKLWVDTFGIMSITNVNTGAMAELEYQQCGWFGAGRYEVAGYTYDADGVPQLLVEGKWNEQMGYSPCDAEGNVAPGAEKVDMWECSKKLKEHPYGFNEFVRDTINSWEGAGLLRSDSRLRPDRAALEVGDSITAQTEKHRLEELQRAEKKKRVADGDEWKPRWFTKDDAAPVYEGEYGAEDCPIFEFNGEFPGDTHDTGTFDRAAAAQEFNPWQYPDLSVGEPK